MVLVCPDTEFVGLDAGWAVKVGGVWPELRKAHKPQKMGARARSGGVIRIGFMRVVETRAPFERDRLLIGKRELRDGSSGDASLNEDMHRQDRSADL